MAVGRDRVRMHREDHVCGELGLDSLADLGELDHRHPDRVAGDVAELVSALGEALRDGAMNVVRARAWTQRRACGLEVLLVGLEHPPRLGTGRCPAGRDRPRDLDPMAAWSR